MREASGFIISSKQKQNNNDGLLPHLGREAEVNWRKSRWGARGLEGMGFGVQGVSILHASGLAAIFISPFQEYKNQPPWVK